MLLSGIDQDPVIQLEYTQAREQSKLRDIQKLVLVILAVTTLTALSVIALHFYQFSAYTLYGAYEFVVAAISVDYVALVALAVVSVKLFLKSREMERKREQIIQEQNEANDITILPSSPGNEPSVEDASTQTPPCIVTLLDSQSMQLSASFSTSMQQIENASTIRLEPAEQGLSAASTQALSTTILAPCASSVSATTSIIPSLSLSTDASQSTSAATFGLTSVSANTSSLTTFAGASLSCTPSSSASALLQSQSCSQMTATTISEANVSKSYLDQIFVVIDGFHLLMREYLKKHCEWKREDFATKTEVKALEKIFSDLKKEISEVTPKDAAMKFLKAHFGPHFPQGIALYSGFRFYDALHMSNLSGKEALIKAHIAQYQKGCELYDLEGVHKVISALGQKPVLSDQFLSSLLCALKSLVEGDNSLVVDPKRAAILGKLFGHLNDHSKRLWSDPKVQAAAKKVVKKRQDGQAFHQGLGNLFAALVTADLSSNFYAECFEEIATSVSSMELLHRQLRFTSFSAEQFLQMIVDIMTRQKPLLIEPSKLLSQIDEDVISLFFRMNKLPVDSDAISLAKQIAKNEYEINSKYKSTDPFVALRLFPENYHGEDPENQYLQVRNNDPLVRLAFEEFRRVGGSERDFIDNFKGRVITIELPSQKKRYAMIIPSPFHAYSFREAGGWFVKVADGGFSEDWIIRPVRAIAQFATYKKMRDFLLDLMKYPVFRPEVTTKPLAGSAKASRPPFSLPSLMLELLNAMRGPFVDGMICKEFHPVFQGIIYEGMIKIARRKRVKD